MRIRLSRSSLSTHLSMLVLGSLASGVTAIGCGGSGGELGSAQAALTGDPGELCTGVVCTATDACHAAGVCDPATGQCGPGASLADTTTGLDHHWIFDEPSGATAIDSAGASNGALGSSALRWPSFDGSGAIAFNPTGECDLGAEVDFGNAPGAFGTTDFTVSFWVATTFSGAGQGDLIGNRVAASHGNFLSGRIPGNGQSSVELDDNVNYAPIVSSTAINDSKWHNIVYVRSGTTLSYYLDGALAGSATTAAPTNVLGANPFKIGRSLPCLGGFRSIAALFDDVRIYHRALGACDVPVLVGGNAGTPATFPRATGDACATNAECASGFCVDGVCCGDCVDLCPGVVCTPIDACHAAGVCNPATGQCGPGASLADTTTGLDHLWTFDESSGSTALDSAGASNGTLGSSALRWPSFDGSGAIALNPTGACDLQAEVDFGNAPGAFGTADFTVSFWVATSFSGAGLGDLIGNRVAASRGNFLSGRLAGNGHPSVELDDNVHFFPISSSTVINDSKWHNIVYSRSGASLSFYLDGALTGSATSTAPANVLGSKPFKIGRSLPCLSGFRSIAALYDDVRIYDRALGACDVPVLVGGDAGTPATFPAATGAACSTNAACASGFCVDGVCCNTACGGSASNDCQACSVAAGAAVDGTCAPRSAGTLCRAAIGVCDVAETCTGSSTVCPTDVLRSAGTVCRGAAGVCDVAESCTGSSAFCPDNALVPAGTVCRAAANGCDVLESCTGSSVACPDNVFKPDLTVCFGGLLGLPGVCLGGSCAL